MHGQDPTTAQALTATLDPSSNRMGVDVSSFVTDAYDYQLLLTYNPVANGGYNAGPYIANTMLPVAQIFPLSRPISRLLKIL